MGRFNGFRFEGLCRAAASSPQTHYMRTEYISSRHLKQVRRAVVDG
jgi:hypothetical protein